MLLKEQERIQAELEQANKRIEEMKAAGVSYQQLRHKEISEERKTFLMGEMAVAHEQGQEIDQLQIEKALWKEIMARQ